MPNKRKTYIERVTLTLNNNQTPPFCIRHVMGCIWDTNPCDIGENRDEI